MNGKCNSGPNGDGECYCQPPFSGPKCDKGNLGTVSVLTHGALNIQLLSVNIIMLILLQLSFPVQFLHLVQTAQPIHTVRETTQMLCANVCLDTRRSEMRVQVFPMFSYVLSIT